MTGHTREQIARLIESRIDTYGCDSWEINNGLCFGFAIDIARRLGPDADVVNSLSKYKLGTFPGHYWVEYDGLHFDAETPYGVELPEMMQYHRRLRAIADSPEDMDEDEAVAAALGHAPVYYGFAR